MSRNTEANRVAYYEANKEERSCPCGNTFSCSRFNSTKHCSLECGNQFRKGVCSLPAQHPVRRRMAQNRSPLGPLRSALSTGPGSAVVDVLKRDLIPTATGCWEWSRRTSKEGYGVVVTGPRGRTSFVHRVMAEAIYGPLGPQPVHHKCANRLCANPDHLQPVSHRENVAEMLQRNYYLSRIAELEEALASLAPMHPVLRGLAAA